MAMPQDKVSAELSAALKTHGVDQEVIEFLSQAEAEQLLLDVKAQREIQQQQEEAEGLQEVIKLSELEAKARQEREAKEAEDNVEVALEFIREENREKREKAKREKEAKAAQDAIKKAPVALAPAPAPIAGGPVMAPAPIPAPRRVPEQDGDALEQALRQIEQEKAEQKQKAEADRKAHIAKLREQEEKELNEAIRISAEAERKLAADEQNALRHAMGASHLSEVERKFKQEQRENDNLGAATAQSLTEDHNQAKDAKVAEEEQELEKILRESAIEAAYQRQFREEAGLAPAQVAAPVLAPAPLAGDQYKIVWDEADPELDEQEGEEAAEIPLPVALPAAAPAPAAKPPVAAQSAKPAADAHLEQIAKNALLRLNQIHRAKALAKQNNQGPKVVSKP